MHQDEKDARAFAEFKGIKYLGYHNDKDGDAIILHLHPRLPYVCIVPHGFSNMSEKNVK